MLSLLLLFSASAPAQLPMPARPLSIRQTGVEFIPGLVTRLDSGSSLSDIHLKANYEVWQDNGNRWSREKYNEVRPPSKAWQVRDQIARREFQDEPCPSRAWDGVYQERLDFVSCPRLVGEVVGYRLIRNNVYNLRIDSMVDAYLALEASNDTPQGYFAVIEGMPFCIVRAKSIDDLERKVVSQFHAFVESVSAVEEAYPPTRSRPAVPDVAYPTIAGSLRPW